jgi:LacI family transcriptional regulator
MPHHLRIAVAMESHRRSLRAVLRGIAAYARDFGPWSLVHEEGPLSPETIDKLRTWSGDGVVIYSADRELVASIKSLNVPVINLYHVFDDDDVIQMTRHHQAIAERVADHLIERQFPHFAFCGFRDAGYSQQRAKAFVAYLATKGIHPSVFTNLPCDPGIPVGRDSRQSEAALGQWLAALPKPVGVMTCNDFCGQKVLRQCAHQRIAVPKDVAVVGVDNDDVICNWCTPPLSSVDPNQEKIGYAMAAVLAQKIQGGCLPFRARLVEPAGVVLRASSDVLAVADREVAEALEHIRRHACDGLQEKDLLYVVRLSRRTLERRFARLVGRTPREEIVRRQMDRVQGLLRETDLPLREIARITGFAYTESMCRRFKQVLGESPGEYRQRFAQAKDDHQR